MVASGIHLSFSLTLFLGFCWGVDIGEREIIIMIVDDG